MVWSLSVSNHFSYFLDNIQWAASTRQVYFPPVGNIRKQCLTDSPTFPRIRSQLPRAQYSQEVVFPAPLAHKFPNTILLFWKRNWNWSTSTLIAVGFTSFSQFPMIFISQSFGRSTLIRCLDLTFFEEAFFFCLFESNPHGFSPWCFRLLVDVECQSSSFL